jgi:hypothetical protein
MKKIKIDFVKIKLHSSENIEWYFVQLELNWNTLNGIHILL